MAKYVAFLRGINVSGQKIIKMDALRNAFDHAGFSEVKTYIQSGNVLFNENSLDEISLINAIEDLIQHHFGFRTEVILRQHADLESVLQQVEILRKNPDVGPKIYVTLLKRHFSQETVYPLFSKNKDVEVIFNNQRDFVSVSNLFKGTYGFPNAFIEKITGIPATTRNPDTLQKILAL